MLPAGTPLGVYIFMYEICSILYPESCSTAISTIDVMDYSLGVAASADSGALVNSVG